MHRNWLPPTNQAHRLVSCARTGNKENKEASFLKSPPLAPYELALRIFSYILIGESRAISSSRDSLMHTFQGYMWIACGVIYVMSYMLKARSLELSRMKRI